MGVTKADLDAFAEEAMLMKSLRPHPNIVAFQVWALLLLFH
jgi:hypothetical protein